MVGDPLKLSQELEAAIPMTQADRRSTPLRVVLWGTCDTGKPRVRILCEGLRANGVEVIECHADVWAGIEDKSQIKNGLRWIGLLARILLAYPLLAWRYLRQPRHDWVLLGYPAIPDIFVIRLLAWFRGTPIALDWFLSAYDTVVMDRKLVSRRHPLSWCLYATEWLAVRLADCVFMDTRAHADRLAAVFGMPPRSIGSVWVGAETSQFQPADASHGHSPDHTFTVLFYGQFIPLHGIPTIVEAAHLLRGEDIRWIVIGRGQESARVKAQLEHSPLPNLEWIEWVPYARLNQWLQSADVCLGIFGNSD
ncbi:MAG TPA: glycosyltransferase, partial [Lysobacter sp.]|nr:glycosyltransferase [Lysobacter sp.]